LPCFLLLATNMWWNSYMYTWSRICTPSIQRLSKLPDSARVRWSLFIMSDVKYWTASYRINKDAGVMKNQWLKITQNQSPYLHVFYWFGGPRPQLWIHLWQMRVLFRYFQQISFSLTNNYIGSSGIYTITVVYMAFVK